MKEIVCKIPNLYYHVGTKDKVASTRMLKVDYETHHEYKCW